MLVVCSIQMTLIQFRGLDEDEDQEDGLDNQPAPLFTKRVGNYVAGPGRGNGK